MRRLLAALLLLATPATAAPATAIEVTVSEAWARATAPGADTGVMYLTLRAHGGADRLVGVETPAAGMAMLHASEMAGDVSTMRDVAGIDLPADVDVTLRPGGIHIMLMGVAHPLRQGDRFAATLRFAAAPPQTVQVIVAGLGASTPP